MLKELNEIMKEEVGKDGYVRIDTITINPKQTDDDIFIVEGHCGEASNGKVFWEEYFKLQYKSRASFEFIKGMFYKALQDILE